MDIRNFFSAKAKPQKAAKNGDDNSDDVAGAKRKKRAKAVIEDSDSDSDFVAATPEVKKSRKEEKAKPRRESPRKRKKDDERAAEAETEAEKKKRKDVTPADFFGSKDKAKGKANSPEKAKRGGGDANLKDGMVNGNGKVHGVDKVEERSRKTSGEKGEPSKRDKDNKSKKESRTEDHKPEKSPKKERGEPSKRDKVVKDDKKASRPADPRQFAKIKKEKLNGGQPVPAVSPVEVSGNGEKSKRASPQQRKPPTPPKINPELSPSPSPSLSQQSSTSVASSIDPSAPTQLWVDKYKPTSAKTIIGQQGDKSNMRKLTNWLVNWEKYHSTPGAKLPPRPPPWHTAGDTGGWAKSALLSGPPGVGKTTTAYLVSKELGYDVMELNASDTRSKKLLAAHVSDALSSRSLSKTSTKRVLLMDEVDGMAGNEDRGGMAELIQLIKGSKIPVICMCNDRNSQKIRSLANHCFDLRFQRPRAEQIKAAMLSVCFKEKLKISPEALTELIVGCNQDVRQVLHHLSVLKARGSDAKLEAADGKREAERAKKTSIQVGPFDVVRKVFSASEHKEMSLMDKSDLFFHDYSLGPLFNQENYLLTKPKAAEDDKKATMELVSRAADCFVSGDLIDATVRSRNAWSLLPTQAMFSSVLPGEYMAGYMSGQIQFPAWFGKYSKQKKIDRLCQELQVHTRLSAGVSKRALVMDFAQSLRDAILRPMKTDGPDGVPASVQAMKDYSLLREDLDGLLEVTQWPDRDLPMKDVDSKVKAAFTRLYNKEVVLPYATSSAVSRKRGGAAAAAADEAEYLEDEGEDGGKESDADDADDIAADAMIKAKKPKGGKGAEAKPSAATKGKAGKGNGGGGKRSKK